MFYVKETSGQIVPYAPGMIERLRTVEATSNSSAVSKIEYSVAQQSSPDNSPKDSATSATTAIFAYEKATHLDTPRHEVILAKEIMSKAVVTISDTASLQAAYSLVTKKRFRHVPVVNDSNKLVGMLSDRDLLRRAADIEGTGSTRWQNDTVTTVMSRPVLVAEDVTEIREVANVMFLERVGCLPIFSDAQLLVGIITRSDILRTLVMKAPLSLWR